MADTATYSPFRVQVYRLAWLATFSMFAIVVLMWASGHNANEVLAEVGIGLLFASGFFSILARRFVPFAWAIAGLVLLGASICA